MLTIDLRSHIIQSHNYTERRIREATKHIDPPTRTIIVKEKLSNMGQDHNRNANGATTGSSNPTVPVAGERAANSDTRNMSQERQIPPVETNGQVQNALQNNLPQVRLEVLHLESLLQFLDKEYQPVKQKMDTLMANNTSTFDILWLLFPEGSEVIFEEPSTRLKMAGKVYIPSKHFLQKIKSASYQIDSQRSQFFQIYVRYIEYNGDTFHYTDVTLYISISFFLISAVSQPSTASRALIVLLYSLFRKSMHD